MPQLMLFLTTAVNLIGVAVSLCLGLYLVTRPPRNRLSWLAAIALWVLSGAFLYNVLVLHFPNSAVLPLLRPLIVLAIPLGFHLALLLPPQEEQQSAEFFQPAVRLPQALQRLLGSLARPLSRMVVPLAYVVALALVVSGVFPAERMTGAAPGSALLLSEWASGPLYPLAITYLVVLVCLTFYHLWQGRRQATSRRLRRHHDRLLAATGLTAAGGLYLSLGVWLHLSLPSLPGDLAIGLAVILLGYTVVRHNATVEGRVLRRDLLYVTLTIGAFTIGYIIVAQVLYLGGHVFSTLTLTLIIVAAISSLMLYDGLRTTLDRLFYQEQFRHLRTNLRALAQEAGTGQPLPERLQAILSALCDTLSVRTGFIALRQEDTFVCQASENAIPLGTTLSVSPLSTGEITNLPRPGAENPPGMALLVPIYDGDEQIGALALGAKQAGKVYSDEDLMLLDDLADQLATLICDTRQQEESARALAEMVADFRQREQALQHQVQRMLAEREEETRPLLEGINEQQFAALTEDALRHLHDYPYLGEHTLAQLQVVTWHLEEDKEAFVTHIDQGKALSEVLDRALTKLRPEDAEPDRYAVPPREWHQFFVLHGAYVEGELNRNIMSRLYISEGTFNRTRRRAVRAVAKALQEMEREARQRAAQVQATT